MKDVGIIIKELRQEKKMSLRYLADKAGISYSYLCNVENGKYKPSSDTLFKLSKALEIDFKSFKNDNNKNLLNELIRLNAQETVDVTFTMIEHVHNNYISDDYDLSSLTGEAIKDIHSLIVDIIKNRLNIYCKKK